MRKKNNKKQLNKILPKTEDEINQKYKIKNINVNEYFDYIEKEKFLDDYIEE
jgi:hypothetical protein